MPLGPYEVTIKAGGFAAAVQEAYVSLGSSVSTNFHLSVAPTSQTAEVVAADAPGIEPTRSATKSILTDLQIHELPSEGRRLQNFVVDTPQALIEPECRGFSISGQKGIYSNISIDGGDYDSTWGCGIRARSESGPSFSLGAIQEIQVVRNTFSAEFGRSTGGVIQLSTKSGTNEFHGTVFELDRNRNFSAPDALGRVHRLRITSSAAPFGGPTARDRTFFFHSSRIPDRQQADRRALLVADHSGSRQHARRPRFARSSAAGNFQRRRSADAQAVITRIDHQFSENNEFFGRFDFTRTLQTNSPSADNLSTGLGIATVTTAAAFEPDHPA